MAKRKRGNRFSSSFFQRIMHYTNNESSPETKKTNGSYIYFIQKEKNTDYETVLTEEGKGHWLKRNDSINNQNHISALDNKGGSRLRRSPRNKNSSSKSSSDSKSSAFDWDEDGIPDTGKAHYRKWKKKSTRSNFFAYSLLNYWKLLMSIILAVFFFISKGWKNEPIIHRGSKNVMGHTNDTPVRNTNTNTNTNTNKAAVIAAMKFEDILQLPFQKRISETFSCDDPLDPDEIEFTFVTQCSYDRLWMLNHHCQRWGGNHPISIAVFANVTMLQIQSEIQNFDHCDIQHISLQIISSIGIPPQNYPVNTLRNLALSAVRTSHLMYADIDFFEAPKLYDILHLPSTRERFSKDNKFAAVIPALAYQRACMEENECVEENLAHMPNSPEEIYAKLKTIQVFPFDPYNKGGHGSTHLWKWCSQTDGSFFDIPCFQSNRYEPYIAARYCDEFPPFQEKFSGYGKNKLTHIMQMRHTGYKFAQLGGAFVVHYPHIVSGSRAEWDKLPVELEFDRTPKNMKKAKESGLLDNVDFTLYKRGQIDRLFVDFRNWLNEEVEDTSRVPMCDDATDDDAKLWVLNI